MDVVRIGALNPPQESRSAWARHIISKAIEDSLEPVLVPLAKVVSFSVTLPPHIHDHLKELAKTKGNTTATVAAGLIEAYLQSAAYHPHAVTEDSVNSGDIPGYGLVREVLRPLLSEAAAEAQKGKIVFAEAATGTGKGRMIAALAAKSLEREGTVVVSAPLNVAWQLIEEMNAIHALRDAGISIALGRNNFISPERAMAWAQEVGNQGLIDWIKDGGKPITPKSVKIDGFITNSLNWLLDDALTIAEDLPVDLATLHREDDVLCPSNRQYKQNRIIGREGRVIICSHHMLAAHTRMLQIRAAGDGLDENDEVSDGMILPMRYANLIVDEAHLLEAAFAAVYSHTIRIRPLLRALNEHASMKHLASHAISTLVSEIHNACGPNSSASITLSEGEYPDLHDAINDLSLVLQAVKSKKGIPVSIRALFMTALKTCRDALSGHSKLSFDLSPVRNYPMMVSGRSNLGRAFDALWSRANSAVLVSATLYTSGKEGGVMRWKLEVPKARCAFLRPVHPDWIFAPVTRQPDSCTQDPDDSPEWYRESAQIIYKASQTATGGMLVLCTSYANIEWLAAELEPLIGHRLTWQSRNSGMATCLAKYKDLYKQGAKPVWLATGTAWTGLDLSDKDVDAKDDYMLSDLVIHRIPIGLNRSLPHERRVAIGGFRIIAQEGIWHFKQGLGRLVRRENVPARRLWVLDARLNKDLVWTKSFISVLKAYKE